MCKKILRRCVWCTPHHLMDDAGNTIPGCTSDDRKDVLFTDTLCAAAERRLNEELDEEDRRHQAVMAAHDDHQDEELVMSAATQEAYKVLDMSDDE